jgi:hypothetical protein
MNIANKNEGHKNTNRYHNESRGKGRTYSMLGESSSGEVIKLYVPASKVSSFADRHAAQMGADAEHDQPLWFLRSLLVTLWIPQGLHIHLPGLLYLLLGPVTDEDGLAAPFDDDVLAFGDRREFDLDFGECEDVGGRGHRCQELGDGGFGDGCGEDAERADHEVGERSVAGRRRGFVRGKIRDLRRIFSDGGGVQ